MYGDGILYSGPTVFGSEKVINGDFATDSDWTKGAGWTISGGTANASATSNTFQQSSATLTGGRKYRVEFEITSYTSGTLNVDLGSSSYSASYTSAGLKSVDLEADGFNRPRFYGGSVTCSIGNVSVKEITQGSDFEFTRATTGTRINEDGYIEDVPYNLLTYSEDFSVWSKEATVTLTANYGLAPDGTQTSTRMQMDANDSIYRSVSSGNTFSVHIKGAAGETIRVANGTTITHTLTGRWDRVSVHDSGDSSTQVTLNTYSSATARDIQIWGAQLVKGDQLKNYLPTTDRINLPRLNYPTYGGCPSLLTEPQRTNIITYSQDISQWGNARTTDTANQITSPDGLNNGTLVEQQSGQTNAGSIFIAVSGLSNGTTYTTSIYAKKKDKDYIVAYDANTNRTYFNLDEGCVKTLGSGVTAEIIAMPNSWYRCVATFPYSLSPTSTNIAWYLGDTDNSTTVTDSGGVYVYGAQFEAGSYPTSLIHTSGSTFTRNEDKAFHAGLGTTDTFNDSEGVLFIETKALQDQVAQARGISINAGNGNNRVLISYPSSSTSAVLGYTQSTAGSGSSMSALGIDITQKHKVAIKYKLNDASFWVDGVKRGADTGVAMPVGLKQLDFSNGINTNTAEYRGSLNAIAVYKTALTDTELANLTSYNNHDLFIPYRSRMQMIGADQELQCTEHDITRFL